MVYLKKIREDAGAAYSCGADGSAEIEGDFHAYSLVVTCPVKPEKSDIALKIMRDEAERMATHCDKAMLDKVCLLYTSRSTRLIYEPKGSYRNFLSTKWYVKERNTMERDRTVTILPLLRTSELRYIVAECMARKGDFEGAYGLLNTMREHRGLNDYKLPTQTTWGDFVKDLVREGQRLSLIHIFR